MIFTSANGITVAADGTILYGQAVGLLTVDSVNVNEALLISGLACNSCD